MMTKRLKRLRLIAFALCVFSTVATSNDLVKRFDNPTQQYKPWAFWYWINGNITQEGIEADLKAMSEAGLGGVVLMHINEHGMVPAGPVRFLSQQYKDLLAHTFEAAHKYNLQINLYNSEGWSVAGGPWITPEMGMKELTWSELNIADRQQTIRFPKPHSPLGYYEDIATLAFPTPPDLIEPHFTTHLDSVYVSGTSSKEQGLQAGQTIVDSDWNTQTSVTVDATSSENFIKFAFNEPYKFKNAFVKFAAYGMMGRNYLLISDDDVNYKEVALTKRGQIYDDIACFEFDGIEAKYVKFVFAPTDNKLLYTAMPKVTVSVREIILDNRQKTKDWCKKAAHSFPFFDAEAERKVFETKLAESAIIDAKSIIDISKYVDKNGKVNWTPPSDNWTLIRFGMSSTEAINRPGSEGGEGLEVDKMNTAALDLHFTGLLSTAKELAGDKVGTTFFSTHADSWEVGRQNWTQGFESTFANKKGYSPISFLPATLGYIIDSPDITERFLWDFRKTIADLIAERFYGGMKERANAMGVKFSAQSMKPFIDNLYALGHADIISANSSFVGLPTANNLRSQRSAYLTAKMTASAGSIYGSFVSSEAFTARPEANRWLNHPEYYKPQADIDLAAGVNQITHHLFTHQPWLNLKPGMTLNYWGVHYERTQTWWHETPTWNNYLTTVQSVLSQGQPVLDILHLLGDDSATKSDSHFVDKILPQGYDFEFISSHGLLHKLKVNDKQKLSYATGREYRILHLADDVSMRPEILIKIEELLKKGAIIVGKPPRFSPSLQGGDKANQTLARLSQKIWSEQYKNQVFSTLTDALNAINLKPDLIITDLQKNGPTDKLVWRHQHIAPSNQDLYFISNIGAKATRFTADFRVTNKYAELWNPYTGERKQITDLQQSDGRTRMTLDIDQVGSFFVVFSDTPSTNEVLNTAQANIVKTLDAPWRVEFIKGVDKPEPITLTTLTDFKDLPQNDIRYFAGTAKYTTEFEYTPSLHTEYSLDLGEVHQFARVSINGHDLGVQMWAPYNFNLDNILRPGKNTISIEVTNLWPNRLIGDERQFPDSAQWKKNGYQGEQLVSFPDWLKGSEPTQPTKRNTFATWKHWSKDDELIPSGLIGPVVIKAKDKRANQDNLQSYVSMKNTVKGLSPMMQEGFEGGGWNAGNSDFSEHKPGLDKTLEPSFKFHQMQGPHSFAADTKVVRAGQYSAKLLWKHDKPGQWNFSADKIDNPDRKAMFHGPNVSHHLAEALYEFSVYFPSKSTQLSSGQEALFFQIHGARDGKSEPNRVPPVALNITANGLSYSHSWDAAKVSTSSGGEGQKKYHLSANLADYQDRWLDVTIHLKTNPYEEKGFLKIWLDGKQMVNLTNVTIGYNDTKGFYPSYGWYLWGKNAFRDQDMTMYLDEIRQIEISPNQQ